ncbi:aarF domain containing kinase 1 isoform X2 [Lycorma delicatula]|uniref:aarF domain containing kinase 1 isoform X2 n=1 Tax=Lycorma delicatula TaxID=130591 RepID=UPI003F515100
MIMWPVKRIFKIGFVTTAFGTAAISLKSNDYNLDSIGIFRFGRAALTVFDITLHYQKNLYSKKAQLLDHSSTEYQQLRSEVHKYSAERLLELCRTNKGVYIKVGQHIGALEYLVPTEYVDVMKVLHSQAPCSSIEDVYKVLREDFKRDPTDIFSRIEPEPQGTASLAQVHKAWLKDGRVVAIKVQHPFVEANSLVDMKTMEGLVKIVQWIFPDFRIQWLVDETKKNIPLELNFLKEAENTEKVREMFKSFSWLKIPELYMDLTTKRVLTMEFLEGGQVNDIDYINRNKISTYEVSDKLGHLYSRMIFNEGFVHSDPHPGNILVHKSETGSVDLILLDHGLYATLSDEVRWAYAKLWLSILNRDFKGMKEQCSKLGVGNMYGLFSCMVCGRTWDSIEAGLNKKKYSIKEKEMFQREVPNLVSQILNILASVNCQLLLILKTNDLIRGIEHALQTQARNISFLVMSRCCVNSVYDERMQKCQGRLARWPRFCQHILYIY